jgi:hypothetical protein
MSVTRVSWAAVVLSVVAVVGAVVAIQRNPAPAAKPAPSAAPRAPLTLIDLQHEYSNEWASDLRRSLEKITGKGKVTVDAETVLTLNADTRRHASVHLPGNGGIYDVGVSAYKVAVVVDSSVPVESANAARDFVQAVMGASPPDSFSFSQAKLH